MRRIINRIALPKLHLWPEADRYYLYPQVFSRAEDRAYTRREVGEDLFGLTYVEGRTKALRSDQVLNAFGLEPIGKDRIQLRGLNLLRLQKDKTYRPTAYALKLGELYWADPSGREWQVALARIILRYEVRCRLLLGLCIRNGYHMRFPTGEFFGNPSSHMELVSNGKSIAPFRDKEVSFNFLLQKNIGWVIGTAWREEAKHFEIVFGDALRFEGVQGAGPSMDNLNAAFKRGLTVFYALGLIVEDTGGWTLDLDRLRQELGDDITEDLLGHKPTDSKTKNPLLLLRQIAAAIADDAGFVSVLALANSWGERMGIALPEREEVLERFLREQMYKERVRLLDTHRGQPRHGRGLFGEADKRMIKLNVDV